MNPDFIFYPLRFSPLTTMDAIISWLNKISPLSQDLVNLWGDYRFMVFFNHICWDLHDFNNLGSLPEQDCLQVLCQVIECPLLARILHAYMWGAIDGDESGFSLFEAHVLLDVSWDDMRTAVCRLRPIIGRDWGKLSGLAAFMWSPRFARVEPWRPLVSMELAQGFIRVLRAIGTGQRPQQFWRKPLHWGRFIRGSPASPELLRDLWDFVPPSRFFASPYRFHDVEFHDVLQWLKKFPEPPLQLIDRWESYFKAEHSRWECEGDPMDLQMAAWRDDYELRWRKGQEEYQEYI
ncbi:hypothetical protein B0H10DRAFT_815224 [Mycena sp. CBHHK59/15]|nr:hypothetical protein B0H10DRAFT_815224 [Mycena sp. CBHHK59/15]